MYIYKINC